MQRSGRVLEIGTSNGYSAIWFADALRDTGGRLTTVEIDGERAATARRNLVRAGLARTRRTRGPRGRRARERR
ncbi:O-methyltransferase [Streptomyces sp. NPDC001544]|uniref:O-methyltransferase n=1 Tax=Streptomyces sp. NPDC001544 TaxID=3364584 RepID=UPI00367A689A